MDLKDGIDIGIAQGHKLQQYSANSEAMLATALGNFQQARAVGVH
jgi:hypothetical protein